MSILIFSYFSTTTLPPECSVPIPGRRTFLSCMKPRWMEKAAIAHYRKAGGFAKIYINDDGLQVNMPSKDME